MLNDSIWWRMEEQRRKLETKIEFKKGVVSKGEAGMRHLLAWAEGIVVQNVKMSIRSLGRSTLFLVSILSPRPRDRPLARNCTFSRSRAPILLFFFPPPLPSFSLFLSSFLLFLEAPLQGGNRKRITAPNFTAHGWNLWGSVLRSKHRY